MIWKIARKEILSNILTMRFTIGTVLFLILIVVFTYVLINDHQQKLENYNELVARNSESFRQLMTYQNLKPTVYKPPEVLAIFCKGVEENINNSARVSIGDVPIVKSASVGGENPLLSIFPVFDIVLIFKIVISILTLLLAYDAISGEKEEKTLGLMLSNSIPRYKILFGKFIGGIITISVPIGIGFFVGGIILTVSPIINLSSSDWLRIILMFFVSLIMVGVLFSLGLFFSAMTKRASDTLMFLLFLWVLFVLVIPNSSTYLESQIKPIESREKINLQVQEIWREFNKEVRDFDIKISKTGTGYDAMSGASEPWGSYYKFATKGLIRGEQKLKAFSEPLRIENVEKAWQLERSYLESLEQQKNMADMFSKFSPISIYEILISGLSRSDVISFEGFYNQAREYRNQLINYLTNKNAFSSIRYFATVNEDHLFDVNSDEEWNELRKKYENEKPSPIDTDDIPKLIYKPESLSGTLIRILPDIGLLCIMGILFFSVHLLPF